MWKMEYYLGLGMPLELSTKYAKFNWRQWASDLKRRFGRNVAEEVEVPAESNFEEMEVDSSNLKKIGYNAVEEILIVEFVRGTVYKYFDFPEDKWEEFKRPKPSYGKWFHKNVKNGPYRYEKVSG